MSRQFRNGLILTVALAASLCAAEPDAKITVLVYNYASIHAAELAQIERDAGTIYAGAGVAVEWLDCPLSPACPIQLTPVNLVLRLMPAALAAHLPRVQHGLGFAMLPEDGSFAMTANVFTDEAANVALDSATLLGAVVAHELGHLLLGVGSHSHIGIMRAKWRHKELTMIVQHVLTFTATEAEKLRDNVHARSVGQAASAACPSARCQ